MCLSAVYEVRDGGEKLVREHVSSLEIGDGFVTITDIMGDEIRIDGALTSIDLVANVIRIAAAS